MIEYIKGELTELNPAYAVLEAAGVGYMLNISLPSFTALEKTTGVVKLWVYEVIREDTHVLYGFVERREREMFEMLIGVSGVGAGTARMILSALTVPELEVVITSGDHTRLKNVKGIGVKTAQRVIVDLRDKIKPSQDTLLLQPDTKESAAQEEALAALVILGFPRAQSLKVLRKLYTDDHGLTVEQAIKKAMTMM